MEWLILVSGTVGVVALVVVTDWLCGWWLRAAERRERRGLRHAQRGCCWCSERHGRLW